MHDYTIDIFCPHCCKGNGSEKKVVDKISNISTEDFGFQPVEKPVDNVYNFLNEADNSDDFPFLPVDNLRKFTTFWKKSWK